MAKKGESVTAQDDLNESINNRLSPLGRKLTGNDLHDDELDAYGRAFKLYAAGLITTEGFTSIVEIPSNTMLTVESLPEINKEALEGIATAIRMPGTIWGMPVVFAPVPSEVEEEKSVIFDEDEEKIPEVMQSDWIHVLSVDEADDEERTVYEAKRLRLGEKERQYLKSTCGIEEAETVIKACEKLWIVRSNKNDSDQTILVDKELKKKFKSVVVNGNAKRTGRDVKTDNQYFWINAVGFVSFDTDLKLDEAESIF